ncbi:MAG: glycosyltransferase family 4 protein [Candidatus Eisenbacteria bacterium]|uniref:Glycosyltransferase family 4 protein n=1 Tax=Eiseniibacteriota bacterium TaxID=2212470 RepID=A0A9D6L7N9_UNCEI|nr:glycosyltransferase family 4 protein [Candidatus Eisenbacteria bacterium]
MNSIAYVTTRFPTTTSFIENEVHRLRARGTRVMVFTLRGASREYQPEHAALLPLTEAVGSPFAPAAWAALLFWLARRPHVLIPEIARILWASRGSLYALLGHVGYLPAAARVALLVERRDVEWVHGAWSHFPGTVAYLTWKLTGRGYSLAAHAGADLYRSQAFLAPKVRAARVVVACVRRNATMLARLAGGGRVECVYHGVDLARFDGAGRRRAATPLLLAVGRLAPAKGFADAIAALVPLRAAGHRATLVIAGDGPERAALEALAARLGVGDAVEFRGALTQEALLPLYRAAWALLAPSKVLPNGRRDGIPNVVVEAMAMGVPCVGTASSGMEELIVPGENGRLVPDSDPPALAAALGTLLADPEALERLGQAARRRVLRDFDAGRNFDRMMALIEARPEPAAHAAFAAAAGS